MLLLSFKFKINKGASGGQAGTAAAVLTSQMMVGYTRLLSDQSEPSGESEVPTF